MNNTVIKKQKMTVVTGTYQDKQTGQSKNRYRQIGEIIHWSDGGISGEIWGPHGCTKIGFYDYEEPGQQNNQQQGFQQQPQQQGFSQQPQGGYQAPAQPQGGYQSPQNNGYSNGSNGS